MRKKILLIGITFILLIWVAAASVDSKLYGTWLARQLERQAIKNGTQLSIGNMSWNGLSVTAEKIVVTTLVNRRFPLTLSLDEFYIKLNWFALLTAKLSLDFKATLYHGQAEGEFNYKFFDNKNNLRASLSHLNIAEHPQLYSLGLSSGTLNLNIPDVTWSATNYIANEIKLKIIKLEKSFETTLTPEITSFPLTVTIPEVKDLHLSTELTVSQDLLTLSDFEQKSSLGSITSNINCKLFSAGIPLCSGNLSTDLAPDGVNLFGSYLPLISAGKLTSTTSKFSAKITNNAFKF